MEDFVQSLNDIEVSNDVATRARSLPFPGVYTVTLHKVGPATTANGNLRREYGRPLFEIESMTIHGPYPNFGTYKLWQRLPMSDVVEFGEKRNYLRELVRAYNDQAVFSTAIEAFQEILPLIEDEKQINVRLAYQAEDFKGLKAVLEEKGLNKPFAQLSDEERKERNQLERSSRVKGLKAFDNGDGTYNSTWVSPFGNAIPVRPYILKFYSSSYNPFTVE